MAFAIAAGLLFFVSWLHKAPDSSGRRDSGTVQVRVVAAQQQACAACAPVKPVSVIQNTTKPYAARVRAVKPAILTGYAANSGGNSMAVSGEDEARYEDILFNHIAKYLRYPRKAGFVCPAGTTFLRIRTSREGSIDSIVVEQSSGCTILDNAAIEAVRLAQPLPPIPSGLPERMTVHMPLSFGKV